MLRAFHPVALFGHTFAVPILSVLLLVVEVSQALAQGNAPANDNFANRTVLTGASLSISSDNRGATKETGEPDHADNAGGSSVWWSWKAPSNGDVRITTDGSTVDTLLAVYVGSTVGNLSVIASNDDQGDPFVILSTSRVRFTVTKDVEYQIAVDGFDGDKGNIALALSFVSEPITRPPNDNFANRAVLSGASATVQGSSINATQEPGEPSHMNNVVDSSVWWTWTAPAAGSVSVSTAGSDFDTVLAVYTGTALTSLVFIASNDQADNNTSTSALTFQAIAGQSYQIVVDGYLWTSGQIRLQLTQDATPPSIPSGLTATAASASQINLSWSASTDSGGSGLAGYKIYRGGVQIASSTNATYQDMGLIMNTAYCYEVAAYDNAGNTSARTAQACATTQAADTMPPSVPAGLTATASSSSQINLSWSAATDAGGSGLAGYKIYRGGVEIAITTATTYQNTSLSAATPYCYTVAAYDNAGNSSAQSPQACSTTQAVVDRTAPSVPLNVTATAASSSQMNLSWGAATDTGGSGLAGYKVYRSGVQIATTTDTTYQNTGLSPDTAYCYTVVAYDNAGNNSAQSALACATTQAGVDTTAPSVPAGLTAAAVSSTQINLSWNVATDTGGSGLAGYKIYRGGTQIGTAVGTTFQNTELAASSRYCYTVAAYDNAGNNSAQGAQVCATTQADTMAPSVPVGLTATAISSSQINLSWSAATDTGGSGLAGYKIFRGGVQIWTAVGTTFQNTELSPSTAYCYTVAAYDNAGNNSAQSAQVCVTTQPGGGGNVSLTTPRVLANGNVQFDILAAAGVRSEIRASPDLKAWSPIGVVTNAGPSSTFTDTSAAGLSQRSYRAVTLP